MPLRIELPRGVSLFEKLLGALSEAEVHRVRQDGFDYTLVWVRPDNERERHPATTLTNRLVAGDLVGTGVFLPIDPHRPRKIIPPELWGHVFIDFEKSELLWGDNKRIIDVEVLSEEESLKLRQTETADGQKPSVHAQRNAPKLTEEGVLTLGKEHFVFPGPKQRRLVELLIRHSEMGGARVKVLLERAGFAPSIATLDRAFQGNPSWAGLRRHLRRQQGVVMLDWDKK